MPKRRGDDAYASNEGKRLCTRLDRRKAYIDFILGKISVDKDDKQNSRELVDETMKEIIDHIRNHQCYGRKYDHRICKAGSHPIGAKIGKADEFDTNILLNVGICWYRRSGGINYKYLNETSNMRQSLSIYNCANDVPIPDGYAVVDVRDIENSERFLHTVMTNQVLYGYGGLVIPRKHVNRNWDGTIDILPRDIKEDFHSKLRTAITYLHMKNVKLDDNAHGPALTLTIAADREQDVHHKISVDLTLSLKCDLKLEEDFGWPRRATLRAFDEELIDRAIDAGIHLVPKKDLFWSISFSRAERALLSGIDANFGCRKRTLKILKYYLEECKSESPYNLEGISSHILKTQVLWSCELHSEDPDYWNNENRDVCLINTMVELEQSLTRACLGDYFNVSTNILQGKNTSVLREFVHYLEKKRLDLYSI